jgi:hypothetical protein
MLVGCGLLPFSSVDTFSAAQTHAIVRLALYLGLTFIWAMFIWWGLWWTRQPVTILALILCTIGSMFPMALMLHVSELYTYNLMPWLAMLVGIGVGQLLNPITAGAHGTNNANKPAASSCRVFFVALVLVVVGVIHVGAVRSKIDLRRTNGALAASLREQLLPILRSAPANAQVILRNTPSPVPHYSVFQVHGFKLLRWTTRHLKQVAHRPDLSISITGPESPLRQGPGQLVLTLQDQRIVPAYPQPAGSLSNQETP